MLKSYYIILLDFPLINTFITHLISKLAFFQNHQILKYYKNVPIPYLRTKIYKSDHNP
jgi:hypothetical protein